MSATWRPQDVPDLSGRVFIVTGGSSGIGLEVCRTLGRRGATVVVASRHAGRVADAVAALRAVLPPATKLHGMVLDLSSLSSVDAFVEAFAALRLPLHALVNCAGVCMPAFSRTPDGFEVQLGTNHVGPSYRTLCLLPALRAAAAPGAPPGRVVFIASNAPHFAPPLAALLRARDVGGAALTQTGFREYACSKAYGVLFARALAARLAAETPPAPLLVSVAHPGFVATPIQSKATGLASALVRLIAQLFALSPARGAHSTLYAATAPAVRSGEGFGPSDYNRGLTMPWAPRGDIFDAPDAADVLFDETLRVLADKGRAVSI